jgi:formyl-CoA transferase
MTEGALSKIKVIDLTAARAGPACVRVLSDFGADVIQVLRPGGAEIDVAFPRFDRENLHRNKRSVAINLQTDEGRAVLLRLVEDADVFVENFRADVKYRLGIDYESIAKVNPKIVYGSISGFGQDGPYGPWAGVDQIAQGMGGLMSITGQPGTGPWRAGIAICDLAAGLHLAHGIMAALIERQTSGKGQWVTTSLLEGIISLLDFQATRWLIGGEVADQAGNAHPTGFLTDLYETSDGYVNVGAHGNGRRYVDFVKTLELDELSAVDDYKKTGFSKEEVDAKVRARLKQKTSQEWTLALNKAGVPCGPVNTIDKVFDDPQVQHLQMAQEVNSQHFGPLKVVRSPVSFSRTPASLRAAAPLPGEQTNEVLSQHGFSESEITALTEKGVIANV